MKSDLDKLQGAWAIAELEMEGQTMPGSMLGNARVVVDGNRFSSTGMGSVYEGIVILHASAKPPSIDLKFDAGPEKGNTNLGIYEISGETWKLCLSTRGDVRPSSFAAPAGSGFVFETLTRTVSPKENTAEKTPAKAASAPSRGFVTEFEGEWKMVSAVMNGVPMEKSATDWVRRVTRGNETTVTAGPQTMMKMEFTSDGSQSPKTIDYLNTAGPHKGKAQKGIYAFEDGMLKLCVSPPDSPRPAQFESISGDQRTFTVWKRD